MIDNIVNVFVSILLFLDSIVYSLISWVYQIILVLCQVDILNNSFEIDALINRIYIIIGVIVMFLFAYSLLKSMVNPDDALKGKKTPITIIKDVIISIVLIALIPNIFSFAMKFQNAILMENTIGKIILGSSPNNLNQTSEEIIKDGGVEISANILQAFLHPEYDKCTLKDDFTYDCSNVEIATKNVIGWVPIVSFFININGGNENYDTIWNSIKESGNFLSITSFAYSISHEAQVSYYYIISTAVGVFVLLVLLSYCIDIAIRTVKLSVFQLIAPLPILSRLMPNEQGNKVFNNWIKATVSTYVEVFIRLAILFFAVLLIKVVVQNLPSLIIGGGFISGTTSFTVYLFAQLFIIIGIILFVKQAPQIIKDITGLDSGKYNVFSSAMRGLSTIGALGTGTVRGFTTGFDKDHIPSSIGRGVKNALFGGAKSFAGASQKEYKGVNDIRKNMNAAVNDVINKQRKKDSAKLSKEQELEEWREKHPNTHNLPNFLYKATSKVHKGISDTGEGVVEWATAGGLEALKQKRDQIAEVQKAAAEVWSLANKEVKSSHEKFYAKDGTRLDELANNVAFYEAQLSSVKADNALTSRYSEIQERLLNERDPMQQGILRNQLAQVQNQIDADIEAKKTSANKKLTEAQEALRDGEKWATQFAINVTAAGKTAGDQVEINGTLRDVEVIGGLSAAIAKADNLLKQNSALLPGDLPGDSTVIITDANGSKEERSRDYKGMRNTLGNAVDKLDADISRYVERKDKKEEK